MEALLGTDGLCLYMSMSVSLYVCVCLCMLVSVSWQISADAVLEIAVFSHYYLLANFLLLPCRGALYFAVGQI